MATSKRMDDAVREYLLYRGLNAAVKTVDSELKSEKDKAFRVDKIVDQIHTYITSYDISALVDFWSTLDQLLFVHADHIQSAAVRKLWTSILRVYLVNAIQTGRNEKVHEFFEKLASQLSSQPEWKDWFVLPFVKNAEEHSTFVMYFNRQWQDTLFLSLHNFLSLMLSIMPKPALLNFEDDHKLLSSLEEENKQLKQRIAELKLQAADVSIEAKKSDKTLGLELPGPVDPYSMPANVEVMDDFYLLTQDNSVVIEQQPARRTDQLKTFIRNIGLPAPPVIGRKISAPTAPYSSVVTTSVSATMPTAASGSPAHKPSESATKNTAVCKPLGDTHRQLSETVVSAAASRQPDATPAMQHVGSVDATSTDTTVTQSAEFLLLSQDEYCEHAACIVQCKFGHSGHSVASLDVDGVLKVWTTQPSPVTIASTMSKSMLTSLEWANKADRLLLLGTKVGSVRVFDIKEKKTVKDVVGDTTCPRVIAIASSPQGLQFTCSAVGRIRSTSPVAEFNAPRVGKLSVWDLRTMKPEQYLPLSPGPIAVNSLVYNHNGQLLLTGAADGLLRLYDINSSSCIAQWGDGKTEVHTVSFSADETSCYSIANDGKLTQWSIHKTGTKMSDFQLHSGASGPFISAGVGGQKQVHAPRGKLFAFDHEGHHMLTCSSQGGLIYKLDDSNGPWTPVLNLRGHRVPVVTVDWSTSVHTCITAALDGRICISALLSQ